MITNRPSSFSSFQINNNQNNNNYDDGKEIGTNFTPFTITTNSLILQFYYENGVTEFTSSNLVLLNSSKQEIWRYLITKINR